MIILDITNARKPKDWFKIWPPNRIRLEKGKYQKDFDIHPMCRHTKWYKALVQTNIERYPRKNHDWPIGVDQGEAEYYGAKLIVENSGRTRNKAE